MQLYSFEKSVHLDLVFVEQAGTYLFPRTILLTFSLATDGERLFDDSKAAGIIQTASFNKIMYFLTEILNHSLVYNIGEMDWDIAAGLHEGFENSSIFVPDPSNDILCALMHAKLNSLCLPDSFVSRIKISNEDLGYSNEYINTKPKDKCHILPSIDIWMGEFTQWEDPWWYRDDFLTVDACAESKEELCQWLQDPQYNLLIKENEILMKELTAGACLLGTTEEPVVTKPGTVIAVDFEKKNWTPTII